MKLIKILGMVGIMGLAVGLLAVGCGDDDDDDDAEDIAEDVEDEVEDAADEAEDAVEGGTNVAIVDNDFDPTSITVSVGDTVTWTNTGGIAHTVTSDEEGVWDSGNLSSGDTFTFTFEEAGTVTYHCNIHSNMQAEVVVE